MLRCIGTIIICSIIKTYTFYFHYSKQIDIFRLGRNTENDFYL
jgi:hypothetical protein